MKAVRFLYILIILIFSTALFAGQYHTDIKIYPSITNSNLSVDYQGHKRYYHLTGSAVMRFSGDVASSPEYYDFDYQAIFNWVTGECRQSVILKSEGKNLTYNVTGYSFEYYSSGGKYPLDPLLYHVYFSGNSNGSLLNYKPFADSDVNSIVFYTSDDSVMVLRDGSPFGGESLAYIFSKENNRYFQWQEQIFNQAKQLNFTNSQNQYITKGNKFVITAQQYIPDDIYNGEDDYKTITIGNVATNLPIMFYGTKALLMFQYVDDSNSSSNDDTFFPVAFSEYVNLHGNSLIYFKDTGEMRTGKWKVTAQITEMGDIKVTDYPVSAPLYFTVNPKLSLWDGLQYNIAITPSMDYDNISFEALLPEGQETFMYLPISMPVIASTFENTLPLGLDSETQDLNIGLPDAADSIDVYVGFSIPSVPQIYLLYPDNSFHPVNEGLKPWKSNITDIIDETVFTGAVISSLPKNTTIDAYIVVTPHNDISKYYFWKTFVVTNH